MRFSQVLQSRFWTLEDNRLANRTSSSQWLLGRILSRFVLLDRKRVWSRLWWPRSNLSNIIKVSLATRITFSADQFWVNYDRWFNCKCPVSRLWWKLYGKNKTYLGALWCNNDLDKSLLVVYHSTTENLLPEIPGGTDNVWHMFHIGHQIKVHFHVDPYC